jgi:hypothetical protein
MRVCEFEYVCVCAYVSIYVCRNAKNLKKIKSQGIQKIQKISKKSKKI